MPPSQMHGLWIRPLCCVVFERSTHRAYHSIGTRPALQLSQPQIATALHPGCRGSGDETPAGIDNQSGNGALNLTNYAFRHSARGNSDEKANALFRFGSAFIFFSLLTTLWSLASPLMSVPDEPSHTIKAAAVARGQFLGTAGQTQGEVLQVTVPKYIADTRGMACYAFKPQITADCSPTLSADRGPAPAITSAGNYNPLYYLAVGLPSRIFAGEPGVYAMRIASGLLCSVFLAATFMAASQFRRRRWPIIATVTSTTPMVLFLCGSINPNALETATAAAVFLNLCLVLDNSADLSRYRINIVIIGISAAILANTRALSLLWLALAVIAALLMSPVRNLLAIFKDKLVIGMTVLIAGATAAGLLWLKASNTLSSLLGTPTEITPEQAFGTMVDRTFDYATGYVARIGWLDTTGPNATFVWWSVLIGGLLLFAVSTGTWRLRAGVIFLVVATIVIPPILQAQVIHDLGYIWQGRYMLPVVVPMILAAGVALRFNELPNTPFARRAAGWAIVLTAAAHAGVFTYGLRRYGVGLLLEANWGDMFTSPKWEPPLGWLPLTLAYLVVLAVGGVLLHHLLFRGGAAKAAGQALETAVVPSIDDVGR